MNPTTYLIKVNIAIALFYGIHQLLLKKDTFFQIKRVVLVASSMFAFAFPFIRFPATFQEASLTSINTTIIKLSEIVTGSPEVLQQPEAGTSGWQLIPILYIIGVILLTLFLLFQLFQLVRRIALSKPIQVEGQKIRVIKGCKTPFSFFNQIVLDPDLYTPMELREILRHEQTHVQQWHSVDVLFYELTCILCWFNPFVWLTKRESRLNLEYIADHSVVSGGCDTKHYQLHLLQLSHSKAIAQLFNNFNVSPLKKRISMMNKEKTQLTGLLKYILFAPLIAGCMFANSVQAQAQVTKDTKAEIKVNSVVPEGEEIFEIVEKEPEFPSENGSLRKYLTENIKYPEEALKKGIQGRVVCQFVIRKTGEISNITIIQGVDPLLDKEALRVIKGMPKWIPGKQHGEAVNVRFTLPITFKLPQNNSGARIEDVEKHVFNHTKTSDMDTIRVTTTITKIPDKNNIIEIRDHKTVNEEK